MTIKEIAKLAGVSSAAVSRYLNGGYVSEEKLLEYTDGRSRMRFTDNRKTCVSAGRDCWYVETDEVTNIRVIADVSSVEVFVNDGEYVFSTRYYPDKYSINVQAEGADICLAEIK